jgi:hypothetical protein
MHNPPVEGTMALRPLRNATISFGLVSIPVRFYTATKSEDVHFNLLHSECGSRVNRKWWCPQHDAEITKDDMTRGYAVAKNRYVTFSNEEIEALESDANRALEITEFVGLGVLRKGVLPRPRAGRREDLPAARRCDAAEEEGRGRALGHGRARAPRDPSPV